MGHVLLEEKHNLNVVTDLISFSVKIACDES